MKASNTGTKGYDRWAKKSRGAENISIDDLLNPENEYGIVETVSTECLALSIVDPFKMEGDVQEKGKKATEMHFEKKLIVFARVSHVPDRAGMMMHTLDR